MNAVAKTDIGDTYNTYDIGADLCAILYYLNDNQANTLNLGNSVCTSISTLKPFITL